MQSDKNINKIKVIASIFVAVIFLALSLTMILSSTEANAQTSNQPTGTYIWGTPVSTPVTDLNPLTALNLAGEATVVMYPVSLYYSLANGNLIPWLATNWTISPNGTVWTFNLVHNATWMLGTNVAEPITAYDVAFTFDVLKANSTLDAYGVDPYIKSVNVINNYTVQFILNSTSVMLFTYISTQTIIPHNWANAVNGNLSQIGSFDNMNPSYQLQAGPFILTSITESALKFVANPHFWMGSPHVENFIIEPFKSTSAMTLSFESGTIDAEYPAISDYAALKSMPNVVNVIYKEPWSYFLWDNTHATPYNNTYFRQGLAYAINKTQIMQIAEDGIGGPGSFGGEPWTNTSWWAPGLPEYHYNLTLADQCFKEAGLVLSNGFWAYPNGTPVIIKIVEPPVSDWDTAASLIDTDLAHAGFQVVESVVPFSSWASDEFVSNATMAGNYVSYFGATPSFSNPWYVLWDLYTPTSFWDGYITHWNNATVDQIINETSSIVNNNNLLLQKLFVAQKIIAQQVPMVLIGDIGNYYVFNSQKIAGFDQNEPPDQVYNLIRIYIPSSVSPSPPTTTPSTPSSSVPAYIYAIIVIVIIIIIVVPISYIVSKRNKTKKENTSTQEEKPQGGQSNQDNEKKT